VKAHFTSAIVPFSARLVTPLHHRELGRSALIP
jgi:hypothetical protein